MEYLTFALAKGRLAREALKLLERAGVSCPEALDKTTRKLIFVNEEHKYRFFLAKATDVPVYVERGAADIGFAGKDTLLEESRHLCEVLDLGFGFCKMMVAGFDTPESRAKLKHGDGLKIATKYPAIAKAHFAGSGQKVEIIKLNGSVELAPIVGLADFIVDIVETGATLRENGLAVLEEIMGLSARMVVNSASVKVKRKRVADLTAKLAPLVGETEW
ncbi:MAG: ATP phosphoribosyltransferase [Clostridiales bacterium]|nr:ATP phosphoribosyltransferase [Clostridiales bacterium]